MSKRKILKIAIIIICVLIFFFLIFLRQHYVVPIVMYHSVNPQAWPENKLSITVKTFERQMRFLKDNKYNVLSLEALGDLIKNKKKLPPKTLSITFDDGYRDNYIYAFPVLKKYNLPAAIFIIVNEVGRRQGDRLSWAEVKEMLDSGLVSFGSHALDPEPLVNLKSEEEIKRQIWESKKILEEKLGKEIVLFSYPEGRFNAKIKKLVITAGYKTAVSTNPGRSSSPDDIFALKRIRISENASSMFVFWFETSGFYTFFKERRHK